jgi:hypothetical protein
MEDVDERTVTPDADAEPDTTIYQPTTLHPNIVSKVRKDRDKARIHSLGGLSFTSPLPQSLLRFLRDVSKLKGIKRLDVKGGLTFVEFGTPEEQQACIEILHGKYIKASVDENTQIFHFDFATPSEQSTGENVRR